MPISESSGSPDSTSTSRAGLIADGSSEYCTVLQRPRKSAHRGRQRRTRNPSERRRDCALADVHGQLRTHLDPPLKQRVAGSIPARGARGLAELAASSVPLVGCWCRRARSSRGARTRRRCCCRGGAPPPAASAFAEAPHRKSGKGLIGVPFHQRFSGPRRKSVKWRWGLSGEALPVVPT